MEVAFFGDSLTEGCPGASYIDLMKSELPDESLYNYGKGGDTVISLLKRLGRTRLEPYYDVSFLWIGVNDVLADVSWNYKLIKKIRRQPWARHPAVFEAYYLKLLKDIGKRSGRTAAVSPLFIGEDPADSWNGKLRERANIIKGLSESMENVHFIDLQSVFYAGLKGKKVSPYAAGSLAGKFREVFRSRKTREHEKKKTEGRFHYTIDGIHLNKRGAEIVAAVFLNILRATPHIGA